jgi:hypothetical protein
MLWTPFRIGDARDVPSQKQKQTHVPNFQLVVVLLQSRQAQMLQRVQAEQVQIQQKIWRPKSEQK